MPSNKNSTRIKNLEECIIESDLLRSLVIAFEINEDAISPLFLDDFEDVKRFPGTKKIQDRYRIIPAIPGTYSVFKKEWSTEKKSFILRFLGYEYPGKYMDNLDWEWVLKQEIRKEEEVAKKKHKKAK